jgi:hypothetical protein
VASDTTEEGVMYIRLGPYLEELALAEKAKPEGQRRLVPTMRDIAEAIGYNPVSMSRLATGKIGSLNFKLGAAIIDEVRRWGFPMEVPDLIAYKPAEHS